VPRSIDSTLARETNLVVQTCQITASKLLRGQMCQIAPATPGLWGRFYQWTGSSRQGAQHFLVAIFVVFRVQGAE
jgi:hypothetical protein